jgi:hypothetical protein
MKTASAATLRSIARDSFVKMGVSTLGRLGISAKELARKSGRPREQDGCEWFNVESDKAPHFHDVKNWPRDFAKASLEWAARGHGLAIVDELDVPGSVGDFLAHLPSLMNATNDVTSTFASAIVDRIIDPSERRELLPKVRRLLGVLRAMEKRLEEDEINERSMMKRGAA